MEVVSLPYLVIYYSKKLAEVNACKFATNNDLLSYFGEIFIGLKVLVVANSFPDCSFSSEIPTRSNGKREFGFINLLI
jgi:hypothetical protein